MSRQVLCRNCAWNVSDGFVEQLSGVSLRRESHPGAAGLWWK